MGIWYWVSDLVVSEGNEDPANRVQNTVIPSYGLSKQQIKFGKVICPYDKNEERTNSEVSELLQLY